MLRTPYLLRAAIAAALLASVAACSSSSDDPVAVTPTPTPTTPATPGDTYAVTSTNRLISFNGAAPAQRTSTSISGLQTGESVVGIDFRPAGTPAGELYALGSTGRLYTVNVATAAATLKSTLSADPTDGTSPYSGLAGTEFGVDFNPLADRLRVTSNTGLNLRINVDTGATTTDGALNAAGVPSTGVSAAAYTNSFATACRTVIFYIDATADRLVTAADPNSGVVTDVGALGVNIGGNNAFEIVTAADGSNTAILVGNTTSAATLYSVALTTGATSVLGTITGLDTSETLRGITAAPPVTSPTQAVGNALAVSATNKLISFNAASPQRLCTSAAISGLQASENVLGIDTRPADSAGYVLGSTGRIYTVNATTGAATLKSTLAADAADLTSPFTVLDGSEFGVDFNPVPDRLRVVSNTGQNLRINVDTGATTTDTVLNPAVSAVTAAAYSNSFAGADSTTLYVVDSTADRLLIQGQPSGNPNNGDLLAVGPLGIGDVQGVGGFDVAGTNNAGSAALNLAGATTSNLYTVNLTTGAATLVNTIGGGEIVRGFTLGAAASAKVYGIAGALRLVSFTTAAPGTFTSDVMITGLTGGESIVGADFRPANGQLFALTDAGRVYRINLTTGVATSVSALALDPADVTSPFTALSGVSYGVDFNPTVDRLRTVSDTGLNLRSNVDVGLTTTDTTLARAPFGVTAAAYTNSFAGATATTLYVIDSRNDRLLTQSPPNEGRLVDTGALGIDVAAVNGFDIAGPDTAVAALSTAANATGFYTVNLTTGAATLVGNIALPLAGDRVTGIATPTSASTPAAGSTVYALVNAAALASFARNAPMGATAPVAITGLQVSETVRGIDVRPADGLLYALGSTGRLYTVDTATAAATQVASLAADVTDLTAPFTLLDGVDFGTDFNPVADRLRVVSDTSQNLRINVATGATTTDTSLNFPVPQMVAAAYTQSFAGATTTRLFGIDAATLTLQLQNPPNDGTLITVGRLDPALTLANASVSFDIAGGEDGLSLAAMVPAAATQSTLYRINLRNGAATALGVIGPADTLPLRALSIQLQ